MCVHLVLQLELLATPLKLSLQPIDCLRSLLLENPKPFFLRMRHAVPRHFHGVFAARTGTHICAVLSGFNLF